MAVSAGSLLRGRAETLRAGGNLVKSLGWVCIVAGLAVCVALTFDGSGGAAIVALFVGVVQGAGLVVLGLIASAIGDLLDTAADEVREGQFSEE